MTGVSNVFGFIYIIWVREFMQHNEPVFKIGMTTDLTKRMKQYPNGSKLYLAIYTDNAEEYERYLINKFKQDFKRRKDIGNEYFEGNVDEMMSQITSYIRDNSKVTTINVDKPRKVDVSVQVDKPHDEDVSIHVEVPFVLDTPTEIDVDIPTQVDIPNPAVEDKPLFENSKKFSCLRCFYETTHKTHMIKHLNTQKPCIVRNQDIDREQLIADVEKKKTIHDQVAELYSLYHKLEREHVTLKQETLKLTQKHKSYIDTKPPTHFGCESYQHISNTILYKCLKEKDLPLLMISVHFDKNFLQNYTIRSKNRDYFEYFNGSWMVGLKSDVIEKWIVEVAVRILSRVYNDNITQPDIKGAKDWIISIKNLDADTIKTQKPKLATTILNHSIKRTKPL